MIRTNNADSTIIQRLTQRITITFRLDGRIALDACPKQGIVSVAEKQMRDCCLCCDIRIVTKEFQFTGRCEMSHMQASLVLLCQGHSQMCAFITSLSTPYFRMMGYVRVISILLLCSSHIAINDTRILTMYHDRHISRGKYLIKGFLTINKHISRRTTHEKFNSRNTSLIELREERHIIVRSPKEKGIVDMTLLCT